MDIPANKINTGILYVTNRIMGLDLALREYSQITGIAFPEITLSSSVQNLSHPAPMVPFASVTPRMIAGHIPHYTQYPSPGFKGSSHPEQVQKRISRWRGIFNLSLHSTMQQGRGRSAPIRGAHEGTSSI